MTVMPDTVKRVWLEWQKDLGHINKRTTNVERAWNSFGPLACGDHEQGLSCPCDGESLSLEKLLIPLLAFSAERAELRYYIHIERGYGISVGVGSEDVSKNSAFWRHDKDVDMDECKALIVLAIDVIEKFRGEKT